MAPTEENDASVLHESPRGKKSKERRKVSQLQDAVDGTNSPGGVLNQSDSEQEEEGGLANMVPRDATPDDELNFEKTVRTKKRKKASVQSDEPIDAQDDNDNGNNGEGPPRAGNARERSSASRKAYRAAAAENGYVTSDESASCAAVLNPCLSIRDVSRLVRGHGFEPDHTSYSIAEAQQRIALLYEQVPRAALKGIQIEAEPMLRLIVEIAHANAYHRGVQSITENDARRAIQSFNHVYEYFDPQPSAGLLRFAKAARKTSIKAEGKQRGSNSKQIMKSKKVSSDRKVLEPDDDAGQEFIAEYLKDDKAKRAKEAKQNRTIVDAYNKETKANYERKGKKVPDGLLKKPYK